MKLGNQRSSSNIEDRRGSGGGGYGGGGGKMGIVGLIIVLIGAYYGVDLSGLMGSGQMPQLQQEQPSRPVAASAEEEALARFSAQILATTEDAWGSYFRSQGRQYVQPKMVLYRGSTPTACGTGQAAMGPFYCPADQKVYLDLSFYDDMKNQLGAAGDAAFAYVIAHEVGHHVQNLDGTMARVNRARARLNERDANRLSVLVELQADCLAGVWANRAQERQLFEEGDLEEAFNAAEAVGDDRLQQRSRGYAVPDSFTHGTSAQRLQWFRRGLNSGDPAQCNTFAGNI
ncbi:hypothetical protein A7P95_03735 [Eikenella longinqua]|uniref:Neutral zinc metallopeptidase n=1 Tax=Eikenella longinqua TaxID=1795827 RepID=A0A1A9RYS5_9NEIS|nr:neutral zinc metallopeptidase [Eikenella longinqua]OAM29333.1 hypothetical protein A7P95_03735 [Eikenella longinqua]